MMRTLNYLFLCTSLCLSEISNAQIHVRIDLNVSNCVAHTRSIKMLNHIGGGCTKTIALLRSDSAVAPQILRRMGVKDTEIVYQYSSSSEYSSNLIDGVYSRVRLFDGGSTILDIELDALGSYLGLIRSLCADTIVYESVPLHSQIAFSSKSFYAANTSNYWILDRLLHQLHCVSLQPGNVAGAVQTKNLDPGSVSRILPGLGLSSLAKAEDGTTDESVEYNWIAPTDAMGDTATLYITANLQNTDPSTSSGKRLSTRSIFLRLIGDSIISAQAKALSDTGRSAVRPFVAYGGVSTVGDSLLGPVVRNGKADDYPLFGYFRTNPQNAELFLSSVPNFPYPKVLWDNNYQYQLTNGTFGNSTFAFSAFPLVVSTDDWKLHDVSKQLGVEMDSSLARVRFHYHCKKIYDSHGIVSMLCYVRGQALLAHFVKSDMRLIKALPIRIDGFDPVTMVLVDHSLIVAIDKDRKVIWRLRCG